MKKIIKLFLLFLVIINVKVVNAIEFDISADNVILYNLNDNKVLYELESEKSVNVASLTKIMTAIVAIENIEDLSKEVVVTKNAFNGISEYSKMGLQVGNVVTYRDLLYGILLPSGADAVNVMALNLSGSSSSFVELMNNKVAELGLSGTHFDNPIGMDSENNYSTAKDVSRILLYALENETLLAAMERAGLKAPSRCKSGSCGFCHSRLISGEYHVNKEHEYRRLADFKFGFIHPCCTYPESDMEIDVPPFNVGGNQ